ncbi:AT rich interactive domain 5A (MRF1-like) [Cyanidiococcus yangmingshanensis]|uniref:AT rich interactive domain 5A (MRF1-like) n=1 Tax=Cyanidiococcus yangmingshanensis TaxID=2690220 RepID=A0A7J7IJ65_9RHOD|nr:AT rich interactive domain 5A (MRF1-like) [Cyanidiococcus yangmingshanensis]
MITRFDTLLPRLVDMIPPGASAGRVSVQLSIAALDALASLSAFEWVARERIARTPRLVPALMGVVAAAVALRAPELLCYGANVSPEPRREQMAAIGASLSARAALVLLNLAENPHNRQLLLPYESILVYGAMTDKVAGSTLASVLQELAAD